MSDLAVVSLAWVLSYFLRFDTSLFAIEKGIAPFSDYFRMLVFVLPIWAWVFRRAGLYRPMRGSKRIREIVKVVRANSLAVLCLLAVTYLFREKSVPFSRLVFLIFLAVSTIGLVTSRTLIRSLLRSMRIRGYNLRHVLVVGNGELAGRVSRRINQHPEFGFVPVGCLTSETSTNRPPRLRQVVGKFGQGSEAIAASIRHQEEVAKSPSIEEHLPEVIGVYGDIPQILARGGVDSIIVALPLEEQAELKRIISLIGDEIVDVRIVPDYERFIRLGSLIEEFDGLPVMSLASTPLSGANMVLKRAFDLVCASLILVFSSPLLLLIALLVKVGSRGPVFFKQERVSLDGTPFQIIKFRTMVTDAEADGAQFAVKGDPRVTRLGKILRSSNLDELPQLMNVLSGQMSLVGPRPERPVFIEEFRKELPKYMLRHKVPAGMTGWAQVNGWRGNTSIEKRIEHDLYYIENWSVFFDLKILFLTFLRSFFDKNAY